MQGEMREADFLSVAEVGWFSVGRTASEMTLAGETEWAGRTAPTGDGGCSWLSSVPPVSGVPHNHMKEWTGIAAKTETPTVSCHNLGFSLNII